MKSMPIIAMTVALAIGRDALSQSGIPPTFAVGQVWSTKSSFSTTTKVVIGRIDSSNPDVIHVLLTDIRLPSELSTDGRVIHVAHAPFARAALTASVDQLLTVSDRPPGAAFESGYKQWMVANGGVYSIPVSDALTTMFEAMIQRRNPSKHPSLQR